MRSAGCDSRFCQPRLAGGKAGRSFRPLVHHAEAALDLLKDGVVLPCRVAEPATCW